MKKASILLARCLPAFLFAGCTLVFAESDPEPSPRRTTTTPDAGNEPSEAGAPGSGEGGAGAVVLGGGAGGEGGASEVPAGGQGGSSDVGSGEGGSGGALPGLGMACEDESTCVESAPECPAAAGFCTFFCDEAWINGWQAVPEKVAECEQRGGSCTPIGEERSYCVP